MYSQMVVHGGRRRVGALDAALEVCRRVQLVGCAGRQASGRGAEGEPPPYANGLPFSPVPVQASAFWIAGDAAAKQMEE